jgi:nucleotide-binding universal stress UspA family protein
MPENVLVAFDESPQATEALKHALSYYPDANISVLYVQDPTEWIYGDTVGGAYYSEEGYEEAEQQADELLAQAESLSADYDRDITGFTDVGQPTRSIVSFVEEHNIDHIVMGSHGRRGLERFLLGSVAETVIKRSPVSVTIIREVNAE